MFEGFDRFWEASPGSYAEERAAMRLVDLEESYATWEGAAVLASLVGAVLVIVWSYKLHSLHERRGLERDVALGKGWTIGAWFVPLANVVLVPLVLSNLSKMTETAAPLGTRWRNAATNPWAVVFGVAMGVTIVASWASGIDLDAAHTRAEWSGHYGAICVAAVAHAVAGGAMALYLTRLHRRLVDQQP